MQAGTTNDSTHLRTLWRDVVGHLPDDVPQLWKRGLPLDGPQRVTALFEPSHRHGQRAVTGRCPWYRDETVPADPAIGWIHMERDTSEAPVWVTADDPEAYDGHMDSRPLTLSIDAMNESVSVEHDTGMTPVAAQVQATPGEVYHLVDDLLAVADACWGATEYVVNAVIDGTETYMTTLKAPSPDDAVRRAKQLKRAESEDGETSVTTVFAEAYRVYRADTMTTIREDDETDSDHQADNEQ